MKRSWLWIGAGVVVVAFLTLPTLGIAGGQLLGFALVLLCPLLHFLGFHSHGRHGHGDGHGEPRAGQPSAPPAPGPGRLPASDEDGA